MSATKPTRPTYRIERLRPISEHAIPVPTEERPLLVTISVREWIAVQKVRLAVADRNERRALLMANTQN